MESEVFSAKLNLKIDIDAPKPLFQLFSGQRLVFLGLSQLFLYGLFPLPVFRIYIITAVKTYIFIVYYRAISIANVQSVGMKKDLLSIDDLSAEDIRRIIRDARAMKRERENAPEAVLRGKTGVLIFEKPSLRTRITFETALYELGAHGINLAPDMVRMGKRESVEDVARNLERWVHVLIARTFHHDLVKKLAASARIPVINALTDTYHPCQALACALTLDEHTGTLDTQHRICFIGDGNNVCHSLMLLGAKLGYHVTVISPPGYGPDNAVYKRCVELAEQNNGSCTIRHEPGEELSRATLIYTDVWTSMGQEQEAAGRKEAFSYLQVNRELLQHASPEVLVSHCLPAHRGEEITDEVLDSKQCIAFDEAENRLHVQKAVLANLLHL